MTPEAHDHRGAHDEAEGEMRAPAASARGFSLRAFLLELLIYGLLVFGYFFFVLHFLGDWLAGLFRDHRTFYALVAITLIVAQGVVLETITTGLLRLLRARLEK